MSAKRTLAGAAVLALLALGGGPAFAGGSSSPSPSSGESSPGTAVPTDANGALVVTPEQKIDPYVRSSITYVAVQWKAWLFDKNTHKYMNGGGPITLNWGCTGYVVNPDGWIGTAGHCVDPAEAKSAFLDEAVGLAKQGNYAYLGHHYFPDAVIRAYFLDHLKTESSDATGATGTPDRTVAVSWGQNVSGNAIGKGKPARVMTFQPFTKGDAALLKVNETNMNALLLVPGDTTVDVGTPIAAIGYSGTVSDVTDSDYHPSIKTGTISSQKTVGGGLIPVYEIDAAVQHGMSGGPTVNENGQVIGTNSFTNASGDSNFNFVGTSQRMLEALASQGITNELSPDSIAYRAGIDAYFAGDKATAVTKLTTVQADQPGNELATDYLTRAKALADPPSKSSHTLVYAAVGVLILGLIAGGAVALVLKRKKAAPKHTGQQTPQEPAVTQAWAPSGPATGTAVMEAPPAAPPIEDTGPIAPEGHHFCSNCGAPTLSDQKFCSTCGHAN